MELIQNSSPGRHEFVKYLTRTVFTLPSSIFQYHSLSRHLAFDKEACATSAPQNGRRVSRGESEFERLLNLAVLINCFINDLWKDYCGVLFVLVEVNAAS